MMWYMPRIFKTNNGTTNTSLELSASAKCDKSHLPALRMLMRQNKLQYYIVPGEDNHQTEFIAPCDKRREYLSGFAGSAGTAIIGLDRAYLATDSRFWLEAQDVLDSNWTLIKSGGPKEAKDWVEWILARIHDAVIGLDSRLISYANALRLNKCRIVYSSDNLVDKLWSDRPCPPLDPIFIHDVKFSGESAESKIQRLRQWILSSDVNASGTMISDLVSIAYLLNLRGSDVANSPVFHAYLFLALEKPSILFINNAKVPDDAQIYLQKIAVEVRPYSNVWRFLKKKQWGKGNVIISPKASYKIAQMIPSSKLTILPSYIDQMLSVKNETELSGLRNAYLKDGITFVKFLAWLETVVTRGEQISEYEAGQYLTNLRRKQAHFIGLSSDNTSASGPSSALPHYSPSPHGSRIIAKNAPYLNDTGGQFLDGTCDTTRTLHFGTPDPEQKNAYTRVLKGHIALASAVFPHGTSGKQLDIMARNYLWRSGLNFLHGTGHGFGTFLGVHEGVHAFNSDELLVPGMVLTVEPGFYNDGKWGVRLESSFIVQRTKTKHEFNGPVWLSFERLTYVPIQTTMIDADLLTPTEKQWLQNHNQDCLSKLAPHLPHDPSTLKWLQKESIIDL